MTSAQGVKGSYQQRMFTELVILTLDLYVDSCCRCALERIGGYPLTIMNDDGRRTSQRLSYSVTARSRTLSLVVARSQFGLTLLDYSYV